MSWSIRIQRHTPSQNVLVRKYKNPHAYAKLRNELSQWIMVGMANAGIPKAKRRRRLTITRFAKSKRHLLDRGNLVGGCKPLLDAATQQGLILDDKEEHLDDIYHQEVGPAAEVHILVEDL